MTEKNNYTKGSEFAAYGPARRAFDITPLEAELPTPTRAVMVSDFCTITGILVGQEESHTTFELNPGIMYPFSFKIISAVSNSATVKGYA